MKNWTTKNEAEKHSPCDDRWANALAVFADVADDAPVSFLRELNISDFDRLVSGFRPAACLEAERKARELIKAAEYANNNYHECDKCHIEFDVNADATYNVCDSCKATLCPTCFAATLESNVCPVCGKAMNEDEVQAPVLPESDE